MSEKNDDFSATLTWRNITISTLGTSKSQSRTILSNAYGSVKPGEFLAVMGPSGAGKTTLLNCLSNRRQPQLKFESGEILLNSISIKSVPYSSMIGFVPQDDILFTSMTPREILEFSCDLTHDFSKQQRKDMVENTIKDLGLGACADTVVGGGMSRGLSGGEKKRTSVGIELICDPCVLFLDEPTTGLDSFIALSIVQLIANIAKKYNRTVIATIHQPSSQIFLCFDKLLLLSHGVTVYMGKASAATKFFNDLNYPLMKNYNPADHFLSVISQNQIPEFEDPGSSFIESQDKIQKTTYSAPFFKSLYLLTWRAYLEMLRNPLNLASKVFKVIIYSMMCSAVFWGLGYDSQGMYDRESCTFLLVCSFSVEAHLSVLQSFQMQKLVFMREYSQNRYGALPYFLSYNIVTIPVEVIWDIAFLLCIYFPLELNTHDGSFFKFALVCVLSGLTGGGWGMFISIIGSSLEASAVYSMIVLIPMWLCSGFLINYKDLPNWFFIKWIGPYYFSFQAAVITQLQNLQGTDGANNAALHSLNLPNTFTESIWWCILLIIAVRIVDYFLIKFIFRTNK